MKDSGNTTKTLNVAICEDSPSDHERLEEAIRASSITCACSWFKSGEAFLESFESGSYDLVFLDIFMDRATGVEVAERIRNADEDVMLAFVTTSSEFAMEGYRNRVERYLLKPYADQDVHEALMRAATMRRGLQEPSLTIAGEEIPLSRICYAEQQNHSTVIHLIGGRNTTRTGRLDDVQDQLPCPPFYRCHKSYLVNLDHVMKIDKNLNVFVMEGDRSAYIRRANVRDAQKAFEARLIERTKTLGK